MRLKVAVLPGDGIGPEVMNMATRIVRTLADISGFEFQFQEYPIGGAAIEASGFPLPKTTLDACLDSDAIFLGAVGGPQFDSLPKEQRQVFIAHALEGRSFKEIAAETGVNVNTLLARKRYAVLRLRQRLQHIYVRQSPTTH